MLPRRFALVRHVDYTGVSGVGVVAYGVVFGDGHVALRWSSDHPATSVWNSIDDMMAVHGHGEATSIEWLDQLTDLLEQHVVQGTPGRRARRPKTRPESLPVPAYESTDPTEPGRPADDDHAPRGDEDQSQRPGPEDGAPGNEPAPPPAPPGHVHTAAPPPSAPQPPAPAGLSSATPTPQVRPRPIHPSLLTEDSTAGNHEAERRVPPQRRPGRHRRTAPEQESRPSQPIESDRP